jgi:hypothetical protein
MSSDYKYQVAFEIVGISTNLIYFNTLTRIVTGETPVNNDLPWAGYEQHQLTPAEFVDTIRVTRPDEIFLNMPDRDFATQELLRLGIIDVDGFVLFKGDSDGSL